MKRIWCAAAALTAAAVLVAGCGRGGIRFGTAAQGGVYYLFSTEFSDILKNNSVDLSTRETAGSAANIRLLSQGYIDLGLAQSDLISEMYFGQAYGLGENYRGYSAVAALYPEYVQIVTRKDSDIYSIDDLDGRTISVGQEESGTERDAIQILAAYGLDGDSVTESNYNYADAMENLLSGNIDLMFVTAGTPSEILEENADSIRIISIDEKKRERIRTTFDGFEDAVIPAGTYTGQDYDIETISVSAVLLAADSLATDTVYRVTQTLFENQQELSDSIGIELTGSSEAGSTLSIPLHPGAAAWYLDQGITTDAAGEEGTDADD